MMIEEGSLLRSGALVVELIDTFAEAFPMTAARVIVTTDTESWARVAGQTMTGYATSVIGCDAEAGSLRSVAMPSKKQLSIALVSV
jgi:formylmethanofuran:tetrahydromethanopterin formyltransferase